MPAMLANLFELLQWLLIKLAEWCASAESRGVGVGVSIGDDRRAWCAQGVECGGVYVGVFEELQVLLQSTLGLLSLPYNLDPLLLADLPPEDLGLNLLQNLHLVHHHPAYTY